AVFSGGLVRVGDSDAPRCDLFQTQQPTATMARSRLCRGVELHRRLSQPAQRLVENTRLSTLEKCRMLHGLDIQISLGELGPLGVDMLTVGIGGEQRRCEALGAAGQSTHLLDELW